MKFRAVVLGAGPAGCAVALSLREAGVPVTIVEREGFPRYRPGETLHPGIEPLLAQLGASHCLHDAQYVRHEGIWSEWGGPMRFAPYGEDARGKWLGFQAIRSDFDNRLLQFTLERGAELVCAPVTGVARGPGGRISQVQTAKGCLAADWVFDGTGGGHRLARWLSISVRRFSSRLIARFGYVDGVCDEPTPSIRKTKGGWTWVAEIGPGRFQWTTVSRLERHPKRPTSVRGREVGMTRGADVTWRHAKRMADDGWFLLGDSAGVLDPSGSHGVLRAVMSARMAAQQALHGGSRAATVYHDWMCDWFAHDMAELRAAYRGAGDLI